MTLEARITPVWKKQKLFVALFLLAFAVYFFVDGFVRWPRQNEHYAIWRRAKTENRESEWTDYARTHGLKADFWSKHASSHEWKENQLPAKAWSDKQIAGQHVCGTLLTVLSLLMFAYWRQQVRRSLKLDDEAVTSPAGTRVPFSAITGLGLKKWESKGYAVVRYEIDGRKGEFLVDDYKFDTATTRQIVDELKAQLTARGGSVRPSTSSGRPKTELPSPGASPADGAGHG